MSRPAIPKDIERAVKTEAGHRCAIPACKQTPVELHHIEPFSKVQEHTLENLIALCPNCHARADKGEIDKQSLLICKSNLSVLNGRYNETERRVLKKFASEPDLEKITFPTGFDILLHYLIADGIIEKLDDARFFIGNDLVHLSYRLTALGKQFVSNMKAAIELD